MILLSYTQVINLAFMFACNMKNIPLNSELVQ